MVEADDVEIDGRWSGWCNPTHSQECSSWMPARLLRCQDSRWPCLALILALDITT